MSKLLNPATAVAMLAFAAMGPAPAFATNDPEYHPGGRPQANTYVRYAAPLSLHGYYGAHAAPMPAYGELEQQPVTPQFNNPGPQISVPQPGNAVDQLSPLDGAGQPDALGIK